MADSGPCDDSPSSGYCKHSLCWTLAELLSRQLGTKQLCVTWEAWLESWWPGILLLAAGMYTVASWRAPQLLTGEPCHFSVSCSFSLPDYTTYIHSGLCFGFFWVETDQTNKIFGILLLFWGQEVRIHPVTDVGDELTAGSLERWFNSWVWPNSNYLMLSHEVFHCVTALFFDFLMIANK